MSFRSVKLSLFLALVLHLWAPSASSEPFTGSLLWARSEPVMIPGLLKPHFSFGFNREAVQVLSESEPIVVRLQEHLDKLHQHYLLQTPEKQGVLPAPKILVVSSNINNAFSFSFPMCVSLSRGSDKEVDIYEFFSWNGNEFDQELVSEDIRNHSLKGQLNPFGNRCLWINNFDHAGQVEQIVKSLQERNPSCQIEFDRDGLKVNENCISPIFSSSSQKKPADRFRVLKNFSYYATADLIVMNAGLLRTSTETEVLSVLAHEYGHYAKAHATTLIKPPDFYFNGNSLYKNGLPKEDPTLAGFGKMAEEASSKISYFDERFYRAQLHPALGHLYGTLIDKTIHKPGRGFSKILCEDSEKKQDCFQSCANYEQNFKDFSFFNVLKANYDGQVSEDDIGNYLRAESALLACIGHMSPIHAYLFSRFGSDNPLEKFVQKRLTLR